MLINGLRIAQRIEIIKPIGADSLSSFKSSSTNTLATTLEDSDDNPIINDMSSANNKSNGNIILAPLKASNQNKVTKFRM